MLHVNDVRHIKNYELEISFNDGRVGVADLSSALGRGVFSALRDMPLFSSAKVDKELGSVSWSNGADIAPEYLYFLAFQNDKNLEQKFTEWGYTNRKG